MYALKHGYTLSLLSTVTLVLRIMCCSDYEDTAMVDVKRCCTVPRIAGWYGTARNQSSHAPDTIYGSDGSQGHGWKKELDEEYKGVVTGRPDVANGWCRVAVSVSVHSPSRARAPNGSPAAEKYKIIRVARRRHTRGWRAIRTRLPW